MSFCSVTQDVPCLWSEPFFSEVLFSLPFGLPPTESSAGFSMVLLFFLLKFLFYYQECMCVRGCGGQRMTQGSPSFPFLRGSNSGGQPWQQTLFLQNWLSSPLPSSYYYILKTYLFCVWSHMCHSTYVEVRGQPPGISSLFAALRSWSWGTGWQAFPVLAPCCSWS